MKIAIITACPAGVATSFLAAKRLEEKANKQGIETLVECHSNVEPVSILTTDQLASCDKIILAITAKHQVDLARLNGMNVVETTIDKLLQDPQTILDQNGSRYQAPKNSRAVSHGSESYKVVAVTACPTGVAHTFMAAEALENAAQRRGWEIKVETRGSVGAKNQLTKADIEAADFVILATDIEVDRGPFAGKKVYHCSTGAALKKSDQVLDDAPIQARNQAGSADQQSDESSERTGVYKHLLTGVSFMLPMVVAGGLLIALAFLFGGIHAGDAENAGSFAWALSVIGGGTAFKLMIPLLAGYIAYSIADRPGLTPGLIGGMLASSDLLKAGFIGGIFAGFIAGYLALYLNRLLKLPESLAALKPILILPLLTSAITGLAMIYIIGGPTAYIMDHITAFLSGMGRSSALLFGLVLGTMMCFDLGGPINKAAYLFGVGLLEKQTGVDASATMPMAAIMAAGMVPPLGMGLATFIARRKFSKAEAESGKVACVLGACFISEGAIPFAARDPMRVIPANMIGGAITGALSMYLGCELRAPHGGVFVLLIPNAVNHVMLYFMAIIAGSIATGIIYAIIRRADAGEKSAKVASVI